MFADVIAKFSSDMQDMGYGESFEAKVIQAFLTGYRRQCELADTQGPGLCSAPGAITRSTGRIRS